MHDICYSKEMRIHENLIQEFVFTYDEFLTTRYPMLFISEKGATLVSSSNRRSGENTQRNYNRNRRAGWPTERNIHEELTNVVSDGRGRWEVELEVSYLIERFLVDMWYLYAPFPVGMDSALFINIPISELARMDIKRNYNVFLTSFWQVLQVGERGKRFSLVFCNQNSTNTLTFSSLYII